jgi:hypothetical protein
LFGFRFVHIFVVAAGLLLMVVTWMKTALFYTKTQAEVLRVEKRCAPKGRSKEEVTTSCVDARGNKRIRRHLVVLVRYTSPADGRLHNGVLFPIGSKRLEAAQLRPGDHWEILASDDDAEEIKSE